MVVVASNNAVSARRQHRTKAAAGTTAVVKASIAAVCIAVTLCTTSTVAAKYTECPADSPSVEYTWDSDGEHLYVSGEGGCVTLSDIHSQADNSPLVPMNGTEEVDEETGTWLLTKSLSMESGTILLLHDDLGCDELRILSSSNNPYELRGHGSYISLLRTKLFSWSRSKETYDEGASDGTNPRSFVRMLSEIIDDSETCEGAADEDAGEGRMDIINSEVGYLGYQGAESYGLTYKVSGFCADESNPEIFERVQVRGDIRFSDIHHNWFGLYTWGHQDGNWEYNQMHDNGYYGFDPHDDSDNLRIHNNVVWGNGNHGIIASKRCNDVSIQNNWVSDNDLHGIMLHRSSDNGIIRNNTVLASGSACIALFESFDIEVSGNTCDGSEQGIRLSMGSSNNKIFDNKVINTVDRAIWFYLGSDEVIASEDTGGRCTGNLFQNNYINGATYGVYMSEADANEFLDNTFIDTDENEWIDNEELLWKDNNVHDGWVMKMEDVCMNGDSDLEQVSEAGGTDKTC